MIYNTSAKIQIIFEIFLLYLVFFKLFFLTDNFNLYNFKFPSHLRTLAMRPYIRLPQCDSPTISFQNSKSINYKLYTIYFINLLTI